MENFLNKKLSLLCLIVILAFVLYKVFTPSLVIKPTIFLSEQSSMETIDIIQKKDGNVKWHISASKATFLQDNQINISNLKVTFPDKNLEVRSDSGFYNTEDKKLEIKGNIVAFSGGFRVNAQRLMWDANKNEIYSDNAITITGSKFTLQGHGLKATPEKAIIQNNVKAVFEGG